MDARVLPKPVLDRLQVLTEGTHEYRFARNTHVEMDPTLVRFPQRSAHHGP